MYCKLQSSLEMEELMLAVPDLGNDKLKMVRNLSDWLFGSCPIGDTWKLGNGGVGNGPATRPKATSFIKFVVTTFCYANAVGKLAQIWDL